MRTETKENLCTMYVGIKISTAIIENSMEAPQKSICKGDMTNPMFIVV